MFSYNTTHEVLFTYTLVISLDQFYFVNPITKILFLHNYTSTCTILMKSSCWFTVLIVFCRFITLFAFLLFNFLPLILSLSISTPHPSLCMASVFLSLYLCSSIYLSYSLSLSLSLSLSISHPSLPPLSFVLSLTLSISILHLLLKVTTLYVCFSQLET